MIQELTIKLLYQGFSSIYGEDQETLVEVCESIMRGDFAPSKDVKEEVWEFQEGFKPFKIS